MRTLCCTGTSEGGCWGRLARSRSNPFPSCKTFSLFVFFSPVPLSRLHILPLLRLSEFPSWVVMDDRKKVYAIEDQRTGGKEEEGR